ncbi:MAG TPA: hypothetical protein VG477_02370 [Thermoanaerobaculia bacterium]|nr:hypothetical protein [Thermoanaerobaculia bacterium]
MRDDDDLDFAADDDFDPLLDDFEEDELEEDAGAPPQPSAPMSRQEIDAVVDQVLTEELSRLKPGRKPEG